MITGENTRADGLLEKLLAVVGPLQSLAVGFSGGVDSSVVVAAAVRALGPDRVLAVTGDSETLPARELKEAKMLAAVLEVPHVVVKTREFENRKFSSNPVDRCYWCKSELWSRVRSLADDRGIRNVADGVNADDTGDFRPGIKAGDEAGIVHPLVEAGAGKQEVRRLAQALGLPNWDKPAQACLSSRFPYGSPITPEGVRRVGQAEEYLRSRGWGQLRVRDHGDVARIEVPREVVANMAADGQRQEVVREFKKLGYRYVALDLDGFRSGSMNEVL